MTVVKGEFEVAVIPENYKGDDHWKRNQSMSFDEVISVNHLTPYSIKIKSFSSKRADAIITIDGKEIYTQRIAPNSLNYYQSLPNTKGQFTFIQEGTEEFKDAGLYAVDESDRGIVKVTIIPERDILQIYSKIPERNVVQMYSQGVTRSFGGGTGLTGETTQSFVKVGDIDRDYSRHIEFTFKLIPAENIVKPLVVEVDDDIDFSMFFTDNIYLNIQNNNRFNIESEI
jgi:hypothetical protein